MKGGNKGEGKKGEAKTGKDQRMYDVHADLAVDGR